MIYKYYWAFKTFFYRIFFKKIGILSYIGTPICIKGARNILIGNKVRIFPGSRMETHNNGKIIFEDNISVGQNLHIISFENTLIIGSNTTISGNVFISNMDHNYTEINKHILEQNYIYKKTIVGSNCFLGYGVCIQAGTVLGEQCIVGANSVVRGIIPDFSVIVGNPAKIIKRYHSEKKNWEKTDEKGNFII